ncbi:MAG: 30S ribosome-binding factor RbfA [Spirochaetaceae bacterium]|jgi:ribosome-binding factor A|nr:30S ribosome-binding factor RbfA [Spirochaetaceae bacterium]
MPNHRDERLGKLIQEKIGALIVEGKIKDPRVDSFLSVTRADVSNDLSYADVYISSFKSENGLSEGVAGLQSAAGFIQSKLASVLHIRQTPHLRFHADLGPRKSFELNQKIDELAQPSVDGQSDRDDDAAN